jgi:hypothetical protein
VRLSFIGIHLKIKKYVVIDYLTMLCVPTNNKFDVEIGMVKLLRKVISSIFIEINQESFCLKASRQLTNFFFTLLLRELNCHSYRCYTVGVARLV